MLTAVDLHNLDHPDDFTFAPGDRIRLRANESPVTVDQDLHIGVVLWADDYWLVADMPGWAPPIRAVHLERGTIHELQHADGTEITTVAGLLGVADQGTDDDPEEAVEYLRRAQQLRIERALVDWSGETLGLCL